MKKAPKRVGFMNIKYDTQKIKSIISDFANITGISMALLDTNFKYIVKFEYNEPELCRKIQSNPYGRSLCHHSDMDMLLRCRKERGFVSHICHAGITDSVMPIIKDGVITAYIILGRIRQNDSIDRIYDKISWLGESRETLQGNYLKIASYNQSQLKSISNIVSNILFANAITVELDSPLADISEYIVRHLDAKLSVNGICSRFHISKNMLYNLFSNTFDCTINEYIISKRMERAKFYLERGNKPISDIAELVGIPSQAQFCRTFKKNIGVSPSAYRADSQK